jgi:2-succinyl-6-hydroxy-2,4-cyclohexadiene-1-carboxylate synthase
MGGRLALQAALLRPQNFRRTLILSGNPAIPKQDYEDREAWENQWAEKFQTQPWIELESAWQEQSVFKGSHGVPRRRKDELREKLAQSLINWSPRHHLAGLEEVKALSPAVEWAFGALDQKYVEVAKTLASAPVQGQINIIPNAGHRLFTDAADFVVRWIENRGHT